MLQFNIIVPSTTWFPNCCLLVLFSDWFESVTRDGNGDVFCSVLSSLVRTVATVTTYRSRLACHHVWNKGDSLKVGNELRVVILLSKTSIIEVFIFENLK